MVGMLGGCPRLGVPLARVGLGRRGLAASSSESSHKVEVVLKEPPAGKRAEGVGGVGGGAGGCPLALVFGWAGSSSRNLGKYSGIYLDQGIATAQLTLPSSYIFGNTEAVPEVMAGVVDQLEEVGVRERPLPGGPLPV